MIKDFKKATEQLKEFAEVLNSFKSETVQLKLVEFFLGQDFEEEPTTPVQKVVPAAEPVQKVMPAAEPVQEAMPAAEPVQEVIPVEEPVKKLKKEKKVRIKKEKPVEIVATEVAKRPKGRPPKEKEKTEKAKVTKRRIPNRPGPSIILNALLTDNYFTENRTIGQIVEQCDQQYHYKYKSTDLSGTLAKLAKEGVLSRSKNASTNQFEYIKA